jgi:hypothetical protein
MRTIPETVDPEVQARAFEAIRRRLDALASGGRQARTWPAIARELGYADGLACRRAAWRLATRLERIMPDQLAQLAHVANVPATGYAIRRALRALDRLHMPGDVTPRSRLSLQASEVHYRV